MTLLVSLTTYILASLHSHTSHISRITTLPHSSRLGIRETIYHLFHYASLHSAEDKWTIIHNTVEPCLKYCHLHNTDTSLLWTAHLVLAEFLTRSLKIESLDTVLFENLFLKKISEQKRHFFLKLVPYSCLNSHGCAIAIFPHPSTWFQLSACSFYCNYIAVLSPWNLLVSLVLLRGDLVKFCFVFIDNNWNKI